MREVFARVDFDFSFRIPRGRSFGVRVFCFIFFWSSVVLRFLFLRVPLLRKQTVPRRTPLGSVRIAERFVILGREVFAQVDLDFFLLGLPVGVKLGAGCFLLVILHKGA